MKREAATATAMQAKASKEQLQQLATTDLISVLQDYSSETCPFPDYYGGV